MTDDQCLLRDAGIREQEFVQKLIANKQLPRDIKFEDLLSHAVYDSSMDEILVTIKGAFLKFKIVP